MTRRANLPRGEEKPDESLLLQRVQRCSRASITYGLVGAAAIHLRGAPAARALVVARNAGTGASEAELRAWDMHQLECMRQLGQWQVESLSQVFFSQSSLRRSPLKPWSRPKDKKYTRVIPNTSIPFVPRPIPISNHILTLVLEAFRVGDSS